MNSTEIINRFPLCSQEFGNESCAWLIRRATDKSPAHGAAMEKLIKRIEQNLKGDAQAFKKISRVEMAAFCDFAFYLANEQSLRAKLVNIKSDLNDQVWSEMK